jgi:RNA polymerase sigma-70 factor (ECF subfamily)
MRAVQGGDAIAFEALFQRLSPRVLGYLTVQSQDRALAEDLAQATFMKVHRARSSYACGSPVVPWVMAIARRTYIDHWRKLRRDPAPLTGDGKLPDVAQDCRSLGDEQGALIREGLATMPATQSEALLLLKVKGLSLAQAASVAGISVGAMKVRAHRAYEHLRSMVRSKVTS